jgi:hypothetical protein
MSNYLRKDFNYVIDFHGASHGHFLEYLINTWIYNGPRVPRVFTDLGTSHMPRLDPDYRDGCMIKCNHYTELNIENSVPEKIVRISIDDQPSQWIHMVNVMYRVGDVSLEKSYTRIPSEVVKSPSSLRTNWFSKLTDAENTYKIDYEWRWPESDAFYFPMHHLYDLTALYQTMNQCAAFLEQKFTPDQEFCKVWKEFVEFNQGLQCYQRSKKIVEMAFENKDFEFEAIEPEQALINVLLATTVNMHDGTLFTDDQYPTNTKQLWTIIKTHLDEFDNKFN